MTNCLLEAALTYAKLGYPVFPCVPGSKKPLTKNGHLDATTDTNLIRQWWLRQPAANIAVRADGLLVVDRDAESTWLADDKEWLRDLSVVPTAVTGNGGRHFIFRQPPGRNYRCTVSKLAPNVDTRADGGYFLIPPSVSSSGGVYRWVEGRQLCHPPDALSEPPGWLIEQLDEPAASGPKSSPVTESTVLANKIPSGCRNATLARLAGTMRRVGMSESEMRAALECVNAERCQPPLAEREVNRLVTSVTRYEPDQIAVALVENHWAQVFERSDSGDGAPNPGQFPVHLLSVPGFISQVTACNLATAFKPQPVLALAAAIALVGTLTGRKITDHYGTRTNVYCLGVCKSGGGKERARQVNKDILHEAGLEPLLGPEGIASHAGLVSAVEKQPVILFQLDEIGRMLKTIGEPSRSPHLYHIATILMKLFTSSGTMYIGDAYADTKRNKIIYQPHACLYGTTVPQSLYEGLTAESLTEGFLSRMLIFESSDHDPDPQEAVAADIPESILRVARYWGEFNPGGDLSDEYPQPMTVNYCKPAQKLMVALEQHTRKQRQSCSDSVAPMWTRTTEKARKLALIYACSANHESPFVDKAAAEWATELSEYLTRQMIFLAADWISENPFEAKRKRVLREIRSAGEAGLTRTQLYRRTKYLQKRERAEIIDSLLETGEIRQLQEPTKGAPRITYMAL